MTDLTPAQALAAARRHLQAGELTQSEDLYRRLLAADPENPETAAAALHGLGLAADRGGRVEDAVDLLGRAVALQPGAVAYHNNLGNALRRVRRFADAAATFGRAVGLDPAYAKGWRNLGAALVGLGDWGRAHDAYARAAGLDGSDAAAAAGLGDVLMELDRPDEAADAYQSAVRADQGRFAAHLHLGRALHKAGRPDDALLAYDRAVALRPEDAGVRFFQSLALLAVGDYARGWPEYEWRLALPGRPVPPPWLGGVARWHAGEAVAGKTVVLWAEQGLGDTLQFCRYAHVVAAMGALRVVVACQPRLVDLLGGLAGVDRVVPLIGDCPPAGLDPWTVDLHAPLMSLPTLTGTTTLGQVPTVVPYLRPPAGLVRAWGERLDRLLPTAGGGKRPVRVGLCWAGDRRHDSDRWRSVPPAALAPLAQVPGVAYVSLQRPPDAEAAAAEPPDPAALPTRLNVVDVPGANDTMLDTAAVIAHLDVVVAADTAVAHLAGAAGAAAWVLLMHSPDWRWLAGRADSPWYPAARLFRQDRRGDWADVVNRVAAALADAAGRRIE